ncbi:MAG TPA: DNA ligase [Firmicutes bacterium]|nr:DNA ligase [Bacillota bacterium]
MAPLNLTAPVSRWFGKLKPMEPRSRREPFDSPRYYFQIKWDGVRMLVFAENGELRLQNRRGFDRTFQYPEFQELKELLAGREAILDGEVIALEGGKPSFPRVMQRDLCSREQRLKYLRKVYPCTFCAFDLLYLAGEDLTSRPYSYRQEQLTDLFTGAGSIYINENFDSGLNLYSQVVKRQWEGVVAKEKDSRYVWGPQKSGYWLKIKFRRQQLCLVGGISFSGNAPSALLLGAYRDRDLTYIGKAGSGLSRQDLIELNRLAARHTQAQPCFINPPREKGLVWLKPVLTVLVEYAEWTGNLQLRAPVIKGFTSCPPGEARL